VHGADPAPEPAAPVSPRRRAVKSVAELADRVRRPRRGIVVLIYHRVGRSSSMEVDLPTGLFDEQMAALAESGRVTTLDRALELLARPDPPAGVDADHDPVVITFDDGTRDLAELAAPILSGHGLPALLYVATDFVDAGRSFPEDGTPLSWAELADLAEAGWELGSHTHTHALLDRLEAGRVDDELDRSIDLISAHTGRPVAHFAYPKALAGHPSAQRAVRRRFRSAAVAGTHPNRYGDTDPWLLARSPVQLSDGMRWFARKVDGGMGFEDGLRDVVNRVRYARVEN
jgi:peptidoglycan/xylan/chitin deacetylase (PgdA/CDA1 family)